MICIYSLRYFINQSNDWLNMLPNLMSGSNMLGGFWALPNKSADGYMLWPSHQLQRRIIGPVACSIQYRTKSTHQLSQVWEFSKTWKADVKYEELLTHVFKNEYLRSRNMFQWLCSTNQIPVGISNQKAFSPAPFQSSDQQWLLEDN